MVVQWREGKSEPYVVCEVGVPPGALIQGAFDAIEHSCLDGRTDWMKHYHLGLLKSCVNLMKKVLDEQGRET